MSIQKKPGIIFYFILGFVGLSLLLTILFDVLNIFGVKGYMVQTLDVPYFWFHWYVIPFEIPIQWYLLGITLIVFVINAGVAHERHNRKVFGFWLLLSIGLVLMIVEDAGNVRHEFRWMLESVAGEEQYGLLGTTFELFYFAVIGFIMVYALFAYRQAYWDHYQTRNYLFTGYVFYGLGVSSSFLGSAYESVVGFSLYEKTGDFFISRFFIRDEITALANEIALENFEDISFMFMDKVYEESLELIGAGALLTAGVFFMVNFMAKSKSSTPSI